MQQVQASLQEQYKQLCARLGDCEYRLSEFTKERDALIKEMQLVQSLSGLAAQVSSEQSQPVEQTPVAPPAQAPQAP